jgi:HSP20 family protein
MSERARAARADEPGAAEVNIPGFSGLTGMVDALRGMVEQFAETARAARDASGKDASEQADAPEADGNTRTVSFAGGKGRMVFGYTFRMGDDGIAAEPFGDVPPQRATKPEPPARPAALQPITEVFEDGDTVVVVAELPGADPETIVCRPDGRSLLIEASGVRRYRKTLALPVAVRADVAGQSFQNGILEVRLARAAAP